MRRAAILGIVLTIALATGCMRDLPLPALSSQPRIVLLGELVAGDTASIRGGRSYPISQVSAGGIVSDLSVDISDSLATKSPLSGGVIDSVSRLLGTRSYSSAFRIQAGRRYYISATAAGMAAVSCAVEVPNGFRAVVADTASVVVNGLSLLRVRVSLTDNPAERNYYSVEAVKQLLQVDGTFHFGENDYRISDQPRRFDSLLASGVSFPYKLDTTQTGTFRRVAAYTDDERTENLRISNSQSVARRILLSDSLINGQTYTTQVYFDKKDFRPADSAKGVIVILVKSISKSYFDYLRGYELFESSSSLSTIPQPVQIPGNVVNGIGVVGGVYQLRFPYLFDRWLGL